MGAFTIAFDIIIVGALALSWVLLVVHLFFSDNESSLKKILDWVKAQDQPALAGILLFAMAYPLGSAVSRIAQDFLDDDDLHVPVFNYLFRVGVTESSIRTDVFCHTSPREETGSAKPEEKAPPNPAILPPRSTRNSRPTIRIAHIPAGGSSGKPPTRSQTSRSPPNGSTIRKSWPETSSTSTKPPFC